MKTIIAFSDIHYSSLPPLLKEACDNADYVFFLGDGLSRLGDVMFNSNFHGVRGNCDAVPEFPEEEVLQVEDCHILLTHGHAYGVKSDNLNLLYRAQELGCNAVFYGHTHFADVETADGVTLVNPGALYSPRSGNPSYCFAFVQGSRLTAKIVPLFTSQL